jgi:hypothetical protein
MTRLVTQRSLTRAYPPRCQPLAPISRLVTHADIFVRASNIPDARPATAVSALRSPAPGNASGSPVWQTSAANSGVCAPSDIQPDRNISGRTDAAGPDGITVRNICTYVYACASSLFSSSPHDIRIRTLSDEENFTTRTLEQRRREEDDSTESLRRIRRRKTTTSERKIYLGFRTAVATFVPGCF